jgi:hypothetical protein
LGRGKVRDEEGGSERCAWRRGRDVRRVIRAVPRDLGGIVLYSTRRGQGRALAEMG